MRTREIIVCALEVKAIEAVIIGNPNSGSAGEEGYLERFAETRGAGGLEIEVLNTERPDHATELAAMAGDRLVIAAGGDGTVNDAHRNSWVLSASSKDNIPLLSSRWHSPAL